MVEEKGLKKGEGTPALSLSLPLFPFRLFARAKDGERRKKVTAR
jgi:hypothetical protein